MIYNKIFFIPAAVMLLACSKQNWSYQDIQSGLTSYNTQKLYFRCPNPSTGIDIEIVQIENQRYVYLIVHSSPIVPSLSSKTVSSLFKTASVEKKFPLTLLDGGQRITLSEKATHFFLETLLAGQDLEIRLQGYQQKIPSRELKKKLALLENPPRFRNRIHTAL